MNGVKSATTLHQQLLFLVILSGCVLLASSSSDVDNTINDLYENLLQREYTGPISFPNHQVERKAQRSPSLRLRFGRRSDPSMSLLGNRFTRFSEEVNKKPIRSPSLRLRFGKRDPSMYSEDYFSNDLLDMARDQRSPRLRWGRRSDPSMPMLIDQSMMAAAGDGGGSSSSSSEYDNSQPEKRKSVRLRWGRSYNPVAAAAAAATNNEHQVGGGGGDIGGQSDHDDQTDDALNRLGF